MRQGSVGLEAQASSGSLASSLLSHVHRVPLVSSAFPPVSALYPCREIACRLHETYIVEACQKPHMPVSSALEGKSFGGVASCC